MIAAWTALALWPVICIVAYQRTTLPVALCVTVIGGYLLLPSGVSWDLPALPPLNRATIPAFTALLLTAIFARKGKQQTIILEGWVPRGLIVRLLLAVLLAGAFGTVLTNQDALTYGLRTIPGLRLYDGFSIILGQLVMLIPFVLARKVLADPEAHRVLLTALVISAVIYSLPALYEVRMSPQLHRMVYGFFPSSFLQAARDGGFRPSVFLAHGLLLGIYLTLASIAALGLFRGSKAEDRIKWFAAALWLLFVLLLAKTLGALVIVLCLAPVVLLGNPRTWVIVATCVAGLVLTYPILRSLDVAPVQRVMAVAESINPQRAETFSFRVQQEDKLLEKARERPMFGWGIWSRNRVFNEWGRDVSVTDGEWVGALGVGGWFRYIAVFGLICWPIIALCLQRRAAIDPISAALALVLAAKLLDLIPNSGFSPVNWMMVGALLGRLELLQKTEKQIVQTQTQESKLSAAIGYRRGTLADDQQPAVSQRYARVFPDKRSNAKPQTVGQADDTGLKHVSYRRKWLRSGHRK